MDKRRLIAMLAVLVLLGAGSAFQVEAKKDSSQVDPSVFNARTEQEAIDVCGSADTATNAPDARVAKAD
jgi:hypothetical protein